MEFKEVVTCIRDTSIEVRFRLGLPEYIHYHYVKGLITKAKAEQELGTNLNEFIVGRMRRLASHVSRC